jgi:hypothetical protein
MLLMLKVATFSGFLSVFVSRALLRRILNATRRVATQIPNANAQRSPRGEITSVPGLLKHTKLGNFPSVARFPSICRAHYQTVIVFSLSVGVSPRDESRSTVTRNE